MINKGQYKKGSTPFNKGLVRSTYMSEKSIEKCEKTQFKDGERAGEKNNTWKGGVQTPKNDCVWLYDGVNKRKRRPKAVWEAHYGRDLPKNMVIYHLDGNKHNDSIENLEAITRAELIKRNNQRK